MRPSCRAGCPEPRTVRPGSLYHGRGNRHGERTIDEAPIVLDGTAVEVYIRDARLALVNALGFLTLTASYAVVRVVFDVPYLRASIGLYVAVGLLALVAKRRILHERLGWLVTAALVGLVANVVVLVVLVQVNRGTMFAETAAAWVAFCAAHLVDRAGLADV